MHSRVAEVAADIYRLSTYVGAADIVFNQYLIDAGEPLLFHAGLRGLFASVAEAVAEVLPVEGLRWITSGHVEADE
jgi:flavorubredoxin